MGETRRPHIGILPLMLKLYDKAFPELKEKQAEFARTVGRSFGDEARVTVGEVCNAREAVEKTVRGLEADDVDLIAVMCLTYAPSMIAAPALVRTPVAKVLFNTQKMDAIDPAGFNYQDILENHGMHGIQDLANVLRRHAHEYPADAAGARSSAVSWPMRSFEIVTGPWQDARVRRDVVEWARAARAAKDLRAARVGLFGSTFEGMGDFYVDEAAFRAQVGPEVVRVPLSDIGRLAKEAPKKEVDALIEEDRKRFEVDPKVAPEDLERSARLEHAVRAIVARESLHALTLNFLSFAETSDCETVPFLAAAKLLADGFGYGGEGDVTSATCVYMMDRLSAPACFTEMFSMDFAGGRIYMAHMAEGNWRMAPESPRPRLVFREFKFGDCKPYVSILHTFRPGPITLVNLTAGPGGRFQLIAARATVEDLPLLKDQPTPHFFLRPEVELREFLTRYSTLGGSHHLAMVYGDAVETVRRTARFMGIPYYSIA